MEPKLRQYIEGLFAGAPNTKQACELKEEIIRNTIERYHDLIAEGKDSQQAYDLAVEGIGDINELLEHWVQSLLRKNRLQNRSILRNRFHQLTSDEKCSKVLL